MEKKRTKNGNKGRRLLLFAMFLLLLFLTIDTTVAYNCVMTNTLSSYTGYCIDCQKSVIFTKTGAGRVYSLLLDNGVQLTVQKSTFDSSGISETDLEDFNTQRLTFTYYPGLLPAMNNGTLVSISGDSAYRVSAKYAKENLSAMSVLWSISTWIWGTIVFLCDLLPGFLHSRFWNRNLPKIRRIKKSIKQQMIAIKKSRK